MLDMHELPRADHPVGVEIKIIANGAGYKMRVIFEPPYDCCIEETTVALREQIVYRNSGIGQTRCSAYT